MEPQASSSMSFIPLIVIFVVFYFLMIKPQQKKAKEQREMLGSLSVGDELILTSGIICEVDSIPENKNYICVKLGDKNVVRVFRDDIAEKYTEQLGSAQPQTASKDLKFSRRIGSKKDNKNN
ncbi:MAG: preprotein translocase subunit YajC [Rickettsiales bacterium]|nr:preprotein translocase subunit YajC [Rickettsiales bacterium]